MEDERSKEEAISASRGDDHSKAASTPRTSGPADSAPDEYRVLLVDDNAFVRDMFEHAVRRFESQSLHRPAHTVLMAHTAHEALRILEQSRPHLVILDHYLPGMTGCALLRRLRAMDRHEHTKVVVVSTGGEDVRREALEAGATSFMSKPVLLTHIVELLRSVAHDEPACH